MTFADALRLIARPLPPPKTAADIDEREAAALAEIERLNPSPKHVIHRTETTNDGE